MTRERAAWNSLRTALQAAVERFRRLSAVQLGSAAFKLAHESGNDFPFDTTLDKALKTMASQGSIDAVAIMIVLGVSEDEMVAALDQIARRSPDVVEDMQVEALAAMLEEYAEGEVAAGRMTKRRCRQTGRWLYQTVRE